MVVSFTVEEDLDDFTPARLDGIAAVVAQNAAVPQDAVHVTAAAASVLVTAQIAATDAAAAGRITEALVAPGSGIFASREALSAAMLLLELRVLAIRSAPHLLASPAASAAAAALTNGRGGDDGAGMSAGDSVLLTFGLLCMLGAVAGAYAIRRQRRVLGVLGRAQIAGEYLSSEQDGARMLEVGEKRERAPTVRERGVSVRERGLSVRERGLSRYVDMSADGDESKEETKEDERPDVTVAQISASGNAVDQGLVSARM